jgi:hypothetical protein
MTKSNDRLNDLLPVVHRRQDAEQGYPYERCSTIGSR